MTAPLQSIIDNTEDLGPVDGIRPFEIPPLGGAENIQEVGTWTLRTVGPIPSRVCMYRAQDGLLWVGLGRVTLCCAVLCCIVMC